MRQIVVWDFDGSSQVVFRLDQNPLSLDPTHMGVASIIISFVALFFIGLGVMTSWLPVVGSVFAFGSPILAIFGMYLGSKAMSLARRRHDTSGSGLAGVILNTVALLPAFLVAITFGSCNAYLSSKVMDLANEGLHIQMIPGQIPGSSQLPDDDPKPDTSNSDDSNPPLQEDLPPPPLQPGPTK